MRFIGGNMKRATITSITITIFVLTILTAGAVPAPVREADVAPRIEVAFVLDTTASMSLLIEGAKRKIWTIAKQVVGGRPTPAIKLGLVGYRDRSDAYVTKVFDLTDDIDAVYGNLMEFRAYGGSDEPESVNQALHEAVTKLSWNKDPGTLKIVFLVGDAPPHMDYPDDVKYPVTIRLAAQAGIIINTIQCGNNPRTTPFWQEIAGMAEGAYVKIDQSGNMNTVATPVDSELARLGSELTRTVVPYGDAAKQSEVRGKAAAAGRADADRLLYLNIDRAEFGAKVVVTGEGELIWDVVNRKVKLEEIPDSDLPVLMKAMTLQERAAFVEEQFTKRKELQIKVDELATQRDAFIKAEMDKLGTRGAGDSFDSKVAEIIQTQALRRGIKYDIYGAAAK
jgi:Mg-chelatase subunit ChlD